MIAAAPQTQAAADEYATIRRAMMNHWPETEELVIAVRAADRLLTALVGENVLARLAAYGNIARRDLMVPDDR